MKFREAGVPCEVFLEETGDKPVKQFMLAEKKGINAVVIPGENPLSDPLTIRIIPERKSIEGLPFERALEIINKL